MPQRCFHAGEAHSLETSGNTSHTVSVPEAPTLLSVFVFLIKLDIVLFFLMFGWWWFFSFAVSVVLWVWAVWFFSFVLRHLGVLFLYFLFVSLVELQCFTSNSAVAKIPRLE